MSAADVTPERILELRERMDHPESVEDLFDACRTSLRLLAAIRSELDTMQSNASTAAFDKINAHFTESERENVALRAEVERLTNQIEAAKKEAGGFCEAPFDGSLVTAIRTISMRCAASEEARRSDTPLRTDPTGVFKGFDGIHWGYATRPDAASADAGRVDVPEIYHNEFDISPGCEIDAHRTVYFAGVDDAVALIREKCSRLPPSPQPSADVVVVPREEWEAFRTLEDKMRLPTAYLNLREQSCVDALDVLRSSTNAKEGGE